MLHPFACSKISCLTAILSLMGFDPWSVDCRWSRSAWQIACDDVFSCCNQAAATAGIQHLFHINSTEFSNLLFYVCSVYSAANDFYLLELNFSASIDLLPTVIMRLRGHMIYWRFNPDGLVFQTGLFRFPKTGFVECTSSCCGVTCKGFSSFELKRFSRDFTSWILIATFSVSGNFIPDVDAEKLLTPQEIIDYLADKFDICQWRSRVAFFHRAKIKKCFPIFDTLQFNPYRFVMFRKKNEQKAIIGCSVPK